MPWVREWLCIRKTNIYLSLATQKDARQVTSRENIETEYSWLVSVS